MQKYKKIAVFGGSFDPPHIGHEIVVNEALKSLHVEKLFIVPTYLNPFKKESFAPSSLRLNWLKKIFANKKIEVLDFETKQNKTTPTIKTIEYLKNRYDPEEIFLIVGADNWRSIESWYHFDKLRKIVKFVVALRDEVNLPKELKKLPINVKISSSELRSEMDISFIPHIIADEVIEFYKE